MKKSALIIILVLSILTVKAQYTYSPNTYYLIPPTIGCDGVWAIEDTVQCATYALNNCYQFDHSNGDTLFLKLCSTPCSFVATTSNGDICVYAFCDYNPTAIIKPNSFKDYQISTYPNPAANEAVFETITPATETCVIIIYDLNGKSLLSNKLEAGSSKVKFDLSGLSSGVYYYRVYNRGVVQQTNKLILQR